MDTSAEISVFECHLCDKSWDDYEDFRKYRMRKCCICHAEMCRKCFFSVDNPKHHCRSCQNDIRFRGKVPREKNEAIRGRVWMT
jgi:hypothetical protein